MAPLPEVKAAGEDATTDAEEAVACPYAEGKTSIMQFPHLLLGVIALSLCRCGNHSLGNCNRICQSIGAAR